MTLSSVTSHNNLLLEFKKLHTELLLHELHIFPVYDFCKGPAVLTAKRGECVESSNHAACMLKFKAHFSVFPLL